MPDDIRSIADLWPHQAALNARSGYDTASLGQQLRQAEASGKLDNDPELRTRVGEALKSYIDALAGECHELQDTLAWKHWYREAREGKRFMLQDLQNARVEAVDMLFFWISLCQLLGLEPDDVCRLYAAKLGINHRRQDEDRTQAQHADHEHENRHVV
jgi:phosphoribosyl-ATP pyrophosphohydrolase